MNVVLLVGPKKLDCNEILTRHSIYNGTTRSSGKSPLRLIDDQLHFVVLVHALVLSEGARNAVMSRECWEPASCRQIVRNRRDLEFGPTSTPSIMYTVASPCRSARTTELTRPCVRRSSRSCSHDSRP